MKDDKIISKKAMMRDLMEKMMKDNDLISRSALLSNLKEQIPDVENISLFMQIIETQLPAKNIKYDEVLLSEHPDKERVINIIIFTLMMGITMLLAVFILR